MEVLSGRRFGRLTVLDEKISFKNKRNRTECKWLCRCDCGTEKYILERSLLYGNTRSCGCLTRENSAKANSLRLQGMTFGELKVLAVADNHPKDTRGGVWWHCRCSCGNEIDVLASLLATGKKTHCGCKSEPNYYFVDITDKTFNMLTAKYIVERKRGKVIWHCVCECGNEVDVPYNDLVHSNRVSCGCRKIAHESNLSRLLTHVGGTSVDMIKSRKLPSDNTTGYKGVYLIKGKYVAKIVFQQKAYYLGTYDEIEDAAKAREEAEHLLFDGTAAHYERWKARAETDPAWAEENPLQIFVSKKNTAELSVTFLPQI